MNFLCLMIGVAVFYFPAVLIAGKMGGDRAQNIVIFLMVMGTLLFLMGIPVSFYIFLHYGL